MNDTDTITQETILLDLARELVCAHRDYVRAVDSGADQRLVAMTASRFGGMAYAARAALQLSGLGGWSSLEADIERSSRLSRDRGHTLDQYAAVILVDIWTGRS